MPQEGGKFQRNRLPRYKVSEKEVVTHTGPISGRRISTVMVEDFRRDSLKSILCHESILHEDATLNIEHPLSTPCSYLLSLSLNSFSC